MIKQIKNLNNKYPRIVFWSSLFLLISAVSIFAAVLSGPNFVTTNAIPKFTSNKLLANSGITIDNNNNLEGVNNISGAGLFVLNNTPTITNAILLGTTEMEQLNIGTLTLSFASAIPKVDANSNLVIAVAGTDYIAPGFGTNQTTGATNFLIAFTNAYQKIIATNDVAFTNHSGIGSASIRLLPNGANRHVYFPTNWCWLSTNNLTLAGSQFRSTITNGVSRVGWLSIVADGADATNVVATFTQTPQ